MTIKDEIDVLRKALEDIANYGSTHPGHGFSCSKKARQALSDADYALLIIEDNSDSYVPPDTPPL